MTTATVVAPLGIEEIMKLIPHRYPFLMLDKVLAIEPGRSAVGVKNVSINELHFVGHFPNTPIMPGVLIVEAMAQLAGVMLTAGQDETPGNSGIHYLAKIKEAKFLRAVFPSDQMVISVQTRVRQKRMSMVIGTVSVDGNEIAMSEVCLANDRG